MKRKRFKLTDPVLVIDKDRDIVDVGGVIVMAGIGNVQIGHDGSWVSRYSYKSSAYNNFLTRSNSMLFTHSLYKIKTSSRLYSNKLESCLSKIVYDKFFYENNYCYGGRDKKDGIYSESICDDLKKDYLSHDLRTIGCYFYTIDLIRLYANGIVQFAKEHRDLFN